MTNNFLTLSKLAEKVKNLFADYLSEPQWIVAEISELQENKSGHCYLELIEKDFNTDAIIAKQRAIIWSYSYRMIKPYFESTTGHSLEGGIKVLINAFVEFHEVYGLSLKIVNIDPTYTIGDLEQRKQLIIKKLIDEGVFDMNREVDIPEIPQKIAVISSKTAAGYGDWVNQIDNNRYGYKFYYKLFSAYMQGNQAEESIISALDRIYLHEEVFDLVVIIRGGGAQSDLNCFNGYLLSSHIAQFPLPVVTGIGHERDETIADLVSNTKLKTPTAVAEFLIDRVNSVEIYLEELLQQVIYLSKDQLEIKKDELSALSRKFVPTVLKSVNMKEKHLDRLSDLIKSASKYAFIEKENQLSAYNLNLRLHNRIILQNNENDISQLINRLKNGLQSYYSKKQHKCELQTQSLELLSPERTMKRGFSITTINGKLVKTIEEVSESDEMQTILFDGKVFSKVLKKQNK